jgi:TonB family protein
VQPREQKWQLVALLGSVAVHLAFAAWLVWRPEPAPPSHEVTAEFVFQEPTPPVAPPPEPVRPAEPDPRPTTSPPKPTPAVGKTVLQKQPVVVKEPPPSDAPTEAPKEDVPRVRVSLLPGSSFAVSLDAGIAQAEDVPVATGLRALEAPKDLVGLLAKETIGKGRVDRGLVHPYYSQLGKALLKTWDADRAAKSGLKGLLEQTGENMKIYNEIWADRASTYGKSGNPLGDLANTTNRRAAVNDRVMGIAGVDLEQRKEMQKQMKEAYKATRRAVIRVVQDQNGKLLKVELVQPSADQNVDKEALADVRTAAEKLPPPPPEALEGRTTLSSLWSFELVVSISPPVPSFTFEFDEALGFVDMRLPLDRRIYKKVRLVSVE